MKKVYISSDHAGYQLKEELKPLMTKLGFEVIDKGPFIFDESDDYPDFVKLVAKEISMSPSDFGIIIGASGQGEAIVANRFKNVRAVVYYGGKSYQKDISGNKLGLITSTRNHNDANILSLGARFLTERRAEKAVKLFLQTPFSKEERHLRRIRKIEM